jgi:DNA-binding NarL/FixJ family response regulator
MDTFTERREPIRVLLIDDSILTLQGLRVFLPTSRHIEIQGIARTPTEAFHAIRAHQPNIVMLEARVVATRLQGIYQRLKISRRSEAARYYVQLEKDQHGLEGVFHQN